MSFTDDNLPQDESFDGEDDALDDVSLDASDADEEMSGEPEGEDGEEDESALGADGEDDDEAADGTDGDEEEESENARLRRQLAEYEAAARRADYEKQQQANKDYWDGIEGQAQAAFEHEYNQIFARAQTHVDPDAFVREEMRTFTRRVQDWYSRFYASQNEVRRQQYERATLPAYAARIATHFDLTPEQANDLLDYDPDHMVREAQKMARYNQQIRALKKQAQQKKRAAAQGQKAAHNTISGGGRAPAKRVKAGSMAHLKSIFAAANQA